MPARSSFCVQRSSRRRSAFPLADPGQFRAFGRCRDCGRSAGRTSEPRDQAARARRGSEHDPGRSPRRSLPPSQPNCCTVRVSSRRWSPGSSSEYAAPRALPPGHRLSDARNSATVEIILEGVIFLTMGLQLSAIIRQVTSEPAGIERGNGDSRTGSGGHPCHPRCLCGPLLWALHRRSQRPADQASGSRFDPARASKPAAFLIRSRAESPAGV